MKPHLLRRLFTLILVGTVATLASGQGTGGTAAERMDQYARHQFLVETMVQRGVDLANANSPLMRTEVCQQATADFARSYREALTTDDLARATELGEHLTAILKEAFLPSLREAQSLTVAGSPDAERLRELRQQTIGDMARTDAAFPAAGKLAESARATALRATLRELAQTLQPTP
ncbi:MAG: hypothetical protein ACRCZF_15445 [Gemmataceae bacterium]